MSLTISYKPSRQYLLKTVEIVCAGEYLINRHQLANALSIRDKRFFLSEFRSVIRSVALLGIRIFPIESRTFLIDSRFVLDLVRHGWKKLGSRELNKEEAIWMTAVSNCRAEHSAYEGVSKFKSISRGGSWHFGIWGRSLISAKAWQTRGLPAYQS